MKMPNAFFKNMLDVVKEAGFATFQPKQIRFLTGGERKLSRPILDRLVAKGEFAGPFDTLAAAEAYQAPDASGATVVVAPPAADAPGVSDVNDAVSQDAFVAADGAGQADPVIELPPPPAAAAVEAPETSPEATQAIVDGIAAAVVPPVVDELPPPPAAESEAPTAPAAETTAPVEVPHVAPTASESAPTAPTEPPAAESPSPVPALAVAAEAEEDEDDGLIAAAKPDARKGAKKKG